MMKALFSLMPFIILGLWSDSVFSAPLELLLVPQEKSQVGQAAIQVLWESGMVQNASFLFNVGEANALAKFSDEALGKTLKVKLTDSAEKVAFCKWALRNLPMFKVEEIPHVHLSSEPLEHYQWALKNREKTFSVEVNDFINKSFPAIPGEDIHLDGVPAAKKPIIVAVIDSGVDINHPDLKDAIVRHESECTAQEQYQQCLKDKGGAKCDQTFQADHDGNGYPLDCNGWNFALEGSASRAARTGDFIGNNHIKDYGGHGTHVAGIIAAQLNGIGVAGVAPQAKILPVRVINENPYEVIQAMDWTSDLPEGNETALAKQNVGKGIGDIVARGVLYALRSHADVINMSLGWPDHFDSELMRRLLAIAHKQGVLVVAAAGNDSTDSVILPCRYDGVVCVGAHGPDGALTFFSNFGYGVDILAPGWNIVSTFPMDMTPRVFNELRGYEAKDGTSMATPFVSGALARLLGLGLSADEAYSRLLLGARKTAPMNVESQKLFKNISMSGNLDIANSVAVIPQPFIGPSHRAPIRIDWDRKTLTLPLSFSLTNHWLEGKNIYVRATTKKGITFDTNAWNISKWKSGEEKDFSTNLRLANDHVPSEFDIAVNIKGDNAKEHTYLLRAEIFSPISKETMADENTSVLPILNMAGNTEFIQARTILTVQEDFEFGTGREYVFVRDVQGKQELNLAREQKTANRTVLQIVGTYTLSEQGSAVRQVKKMHKFLSKEPFYVILEALPIPKDQKVNANPIQFTHLDQSWQVLEKPIVFDSTLGRFDLDLHQWQKIGNNLVPTWFVSQGLVPPLEREKYNPWKPKAFFELAPRIYYLDNAGLHSIKLTSDYDNVVSFLPQDLEQKKSGIVSVLLSKGKDYGLVYATAELVDGSWRNIKPLAMAEFQHLSVGYSSLKVVSLDAEYPYAGAYFAGLVSSANGPDGGKRTTVINQGKTYSLNTVPVRNFDVILDVPGVFMGNSHHAQFSISRYEIQFTDNDEVKMASLKRSGFQPVQQVLKSYFPALAWNRNNKSYLVPVLFRPGDFVFSKAVDLLLPQYNADGKLGGLIRPAKFHFETVPGCTALPAPRPASSLGPSELVFFCGDKMISVPLNW